MDVQLINKKATGGVVSEGGGVGETSTEFRFEDNAGGYFAENVKSAGGWDEGADTQT